MSQLRELAQELGYCEVWTYLNSGNLVFASDRGVAAVGHELEDALERQFQTRIDVAVRSADRLRELVTENPFPEAPANRVTVALLTGSARADATERIARTAKASEPFVVGEQEVWVHYGQGIADSRLAAQFSRIVGVSATVRNVGTLTKLVTKLNA